ncbi:MAG TPA: ATP-binding protein [Rubricoccaceae bacterium]|jgi:signal transduction histidine kinase
MDAPLPLVSTDLLTALVTAAGERLDASDTWLDLFGTDALWGRLPLDDARFASDYVVEAARGGPVSHQVFLVDRADGGDLPTPVLIHFQPVRMPGMESGRFPVFIVGEVLREPASWAAEQTRRRRFEMLGRMTMGVAHDFNNLLTTVLGHAELIGSDLDACGAPPEAFGHLATLGQAAGDGAALVRRIQQYLRNDKQERAEPVALHELAAEVLTLTKPYWHNEPRRTGIAITVDADLQTVPAIPGTPTELREVLVNLVLNAVQAMPAGGTLRVATSTAPGGVAVEVSDTGEGMSERVQRRIFEPLYTTKGTAGTGMGLTVSQGIVQEHNGRIEVQSAPGRGTRFRLVFPLATAAPAPVAAEPPDADRHEAPARASDDRVSDARPSDARPAARTPAQSARPLRILVVDDEPMVRLVTTKLLRMRGHTVDDVDGGQAALDSLDGVVYDLVVTDLSMPGMSGRELAAEVRARFPALPVVLLTGDTDVRAEGSDVAEVVRKPFQIDALEAVVQRVVG